MLSYNGIVFSYGQTMHHAVGPVRDPSGSDQLFIKIKFKTKSLLYVNDLTGLGITPSTPADIAAGSPAVVATYARIRHMLCAPRKPLYWDATSPSVGGGAPAAGAAAYINLPSGRDDANGPWPDSEAFSVVYTTPTCLEVTWACEVSLIDCQPYASAPDPLSIRWTDSVTIDKYWKMTYNRVGLLIRSSNGADVDSLRRSGVMLPDFPGMPGVLAPGFRRVSSEYKVSPDGLNCNFRFQDEQIRYTPPYPIIDMDINQSETFPNASSVRNGRVSVELRGCQQASVMNLADWALAIFKMRVWAANPIAIDTGKGYLTLGQTTIKTRESVDDVAVAVEGTYKSSTNQKRETSIIPIGGIGAGALFGTSNWLTGLAGPAGLLIDAFASGTAPPTSTGADPSANPVFTWIGAGTTPIIAQPRTDPVWTPPAGTTSTGAQFTNASGNSPDFPNTGWGMASAIQIAASVLKDPCGYYAAVAPSTSSLSGGSSGTGGSSGFGGFAGWIGGGGGFSTDVPESVRFRSRRMMDDPGDDIGPSGTPSFVADVQMQGNTDPTLVSAAIADVLSENDGTVISTVGDTGFFFYDGLSGVYDFWQCMTEFYDDPGVMVLPTANPNGTNIAVQHSSDTLRVMLRWAAKRLGAPPNIPAKVSTDPNLIYVGGMAGLPEEVVGPDGVTITYEARGVYVYEALNPAIVQKNAQIPPFLLTSALSQAAGWFNLYENTGTNPQNSGLQSGIGNGGGSGGQSPPAFAGSASPLGNNPYGNVIPSN